MRTVDIHWLHGLVFDIPFGMHWEKLDWILALMVGFVYSYNGNFWVAAALREMWKMVTEWLPCPVICMMKPIR